MPPIVRRALCLALLFLGTLLLYHEAAQLDYLSYDDDTYITANGAVNQGLSGASIAWAFSSIEYACNWHPLTWISHMADVSFFGLDNPGAHHMTNVVIHGINALLLVWLLFQLSGRFAASWFVGAFFAWHPQRVESVAWISERKDVLAILFGLLSLLVFYRWVRNKETRPRPGLYILACLLFACGLMAKPLLVTLPGCMLLLDRWPWDRHLAFGRALLEKVPFIALSAAACAMTLWSQASGGCTQIIADGLPLMARLENAAIACLQYAGSLVYPHDLVVFYPHPAVLEPELSRSGLALGSAAVLAGALVLAWRQRQQAPYGLFGLLWFLGVLLPMLGIVQVGGQAMADRYTYFSTIGLVLILVFGAADFIERRAQLKLPLLGACLVALGLLARATHSQIPVWKNDSTLFGHAAKLDPRNYVAQNALGTNDALEAQRLLRAGETPAGMAKLKSAIRRLKLACQSHPRHFEARVDLGAALILNSEFEPARSHLELAAGIRPKDDNAQFQLALALYNLKQLDQADAHLAIIRQRNPSYPKLEQLAAVVQKARVPQKP